MTKWAQIGINGTKMESAEEFCLREIQENTIAEKSLITKGN
jgi:hypothetical protein